MADVVVEPDWDRLFPTGDHRFHMAMRRSEPAAYWPSRLGDDAGRAERRRWLAADEAAYLGGELQGPEVREAITWMARASGLRAVPATAREAAEVIAPDWVVLSGDAAAGFPVVGGAVVFPSSWALADKLGRPLAAVHGAVPTLAANLGATMATMLGRMEPGQDWERVNWGLSADAEMNHHPSRALPELTAAAGLATTWLRLESQYLARLPETRAVLFGIRIEPRRLDAVAAVPGVARRLARALTTMDAEVAAYKGLTA